MELTKTSKEAGDTYTATKWMPFEVSIVSIPADPTVGIGRADSDDSIDVRIINKQPQSKRIENTMDEKEKQALEAKIRAEGAADAAKAVESERARIATINAIGKKFGMEALAAELVNGGKSIEEARQAVMEKMGSVQKPVTGTEGEIGLNEKERTQFSFMRAINALANPHDVRLQEAAKFERECSAAAEKAAGKQSQGIMIPTDILRARAQRDMTVGSNSAGGYSVATDLQAGSFIDLLRNKMVAQRLGAQSLNGLQGNIAIPKLTGGATAYWVAENVAPTEGAETLGQVALSPKTVAAYVDYSRKLGIQSSLDFEGMIKNDLAQSLGLAIDAKALYGDGTSNTITGVRYAASVTTVDFAGADPTFAEIVQMESKVAAGNADIGTLAYGFNALARGVLKSTLVTATYGDRMIMGPDNLVNGYRAEVSNQFSKLSTADYDYFFGNWHDLILAFWSGLDLMVDPYTGSKEGTVRVVAFQDVDCAVRHGESFCYGNKTIA
jgi:HK97 family phage major capsid protein